MERNAILATVLVILILVGYQWYLSRFEVSSEQLGKPAPAPARTPPTPAPPPTPSVVETLRPVAKSALLPKGFLLTDELGLKERKVRVDTPLMHVTLSTQGARVTSWQLKRYPTAQGGPVDLVAIHDQGAGIGPLETWLGGLKPPAMYQVDRDRLKLTGDGQTGSVVFTRITPSGIQIEKRLTFRADRYWVEMDLTARNLTGGDVEVQPQLAWGPGFRNSLNKKASTLQPPTLWLNGKRIQENVAKLNGERTIDGTLGWAALNDTYFAAALIPEGKGQQAFVTKGTDEQPVVGLVGAKQTLPPHGEIADKAIVFAGPKDFDLLKAVGHNLDGLVNLGWFWFLARPALWLLKFLYHFTGNYGIAIILVSILQKVAFFPLTQKSLKSMRAMQAIQPKVQALQERFKNNPQKKQEETMALYRKHGVNPLGGCLPMLVQIPIFVALYNALRNSVEMWQARFLWMHDLTRPDSLFTMAVWGGHDFSFNLLALLMGVSMWLQQKMTPISGDPSQAQMMQWMMPIIFTFMFWGFPSGLVLYWLVNNILQIGQQYLITGKARHPAPTQGQSA